MRGIRLFIQDVLLWIRRQLGWLGWPFSEVEADDLVIDPTSPWRVNVAERLTACDNRPGLKKLYVTVLDGNGVPLSGIKVRFGVAPSYGTAYDHPNVWGLTNEQGYLEWEHYGVPTRYTLWMEDDETPLVENIRTDLGYEYCDGWRPVNRPGIYSYRIEVQRKGGGEQYQVPVVSDVQVHVADIEGEEGYTEVTVACKTDRVCEVQAHWGVVYEGAAPGGEWEEVCDPFSVGGFRSGIGEAALEHEISLGRIWCNKSAPVAFCLAVVAWEPQYRGVPRCYGISEAIPFTVP